MSRNQKTETPSAHELARSPVHLLHRAGQCAAEAFLTEIGDMLTPRQYEVLSAVAAADGQSQTSLVNLTGIDRSTLADIVMRLIRKGLVQRRRMKGDARAYSVKLTQNGRSLLRSTAPLVARVDERLLIAIPAADRARFIDELGAIVAKFTPPEDAQQP